MVMAEKSILVYNSESAVLSNYTKELGVNYGICIYQL